MHRRDVVLELRRRLGGRLTDGLLVYLDERGFIDDVSVHGIMTLDQLEREARMILAAGAEPVERIETEPIDPSRRRTGASRMWALSELVAQYARTDPDVVRFREYYLAGALVPWPALSAWIKERADAEARTVDLTVTLPRDALGENSSFLPPLSDPVRIHSFKARILEYVGPDDQWVQHISVPAGGVLDATRVFGEELANAFGWRPAQATAFLLSDVPPVVAPIRISRSMSKTRHGVDLGWAKRIRLDVDPATDPDVVAAKYREARAEMGLHRTSAMSDKHLRLAVFAFVEHAEDSWSGRFHSWNKEFRDWAYSQESNFRRDAARAGRRIMMLDRSRP